MPTCPAVKADGEVCGKNIRGDAIRCATHMGVLHNNGPHATALKEQNYRHRAEIKRLVDERHVRIEAEHNQIVRDRLHEDLDLEIQAVRNRQRREVTNLMREQEDEVRQTGIDPDAPARARRAEELRRRNEINRMHWQQRHAMAVAEDIENQRLGAQLLARANQFAAAVNNARPAVRELANFANDQQNVHTTVAVQQTKDMVERILRIPVPADYKWNMTECSKTPGDIIMCCKLTPRGAWQMSAKYCQNESIYDLGAGIYGKVLDGVWQYIVGSPDKPDLCRILKQEMEDNIGMCAQGNLTRLCNILAGYMEGIGPQESAADVLGRKLPLLLEIENEDDRLKHAYNLLVELGVPQEQWLSWVEPLVERSVRLLSSGSGEVIGFAITA